MPIMNTNFNLSMLSNTYHNMLTTLGPYFLSMEVGHSTGKPMPVLKLLFPSNWLIPDDPQFLVEADYFSDDETLYYVGLEPTNPYSILDDLVRYASEIIKYNDAVEAKKLELAELMRQKEIILEQSIQEYRQKMEEVGLKFREIKPKRPEVQAIPPVHKNVVVHYTDDSIKDVVVNTMENPPIYTPPKRTVLPPSIDPSIFSDEDEPVDPRERLPFNGSSGLMIINEQPQLDRNQVIKQRHDIDENF